MQCTALILECHLGQREIRTLPLLIGLLVLLLSPVGVTAGSTTCPGQRVEVGSDDPQEVTEICSATAAGLSFLASLELRPHRTVYVDVADSFIEHADKLAYGIYTRQSDRVLVMSPSALSGHLPALRMFGLLIDGAMYKAIVAHEVSHAVAQQNSQVDVLSVVAQEYLAFSTLLAILPKIERLEVIGTAGVAAWEAGDDISELYLEFGPHRFAVKSYLHLHDHPNPVAFIQKVLTTRGSSFQAE